MTLSTCVKQLEKESKEAQVKDAHRKKTGVVTLLFTMQINHNMIHSTQFGGPTVVREAVPPVITCKQFFSSCLIFDLDINRLKCLSIMQAS